MLPTGRRCRSSNSSLSSSILVKTRTTLLCWSRVPKISVYSTLLTFTCSSVLSFCSNTLQLRRWDWLSIASLSIQLSWHLMLLLNMEGKLFLIFLVIELLKSNNTLTILVENLFDTMYGWILNSLYVMSLTFVCFSWTNFISSKAASLIFFLIIALSSLLVFKHLFDLFDLFDGI